nr:putative cytosolic iron-sulfur protein assembly protein CIAO1 [Cryptomonas paramecium]
MLNLVCLNTFQGHSASVWKIKWSLHGELLISSGADGLILVWGSFFYRNNYNANLKSVINLSYFFKWKLLCKFNLISVYKSYKDINWSPNTSEFCVVNFSGIFHTCQIIFFNKKKSISFKKKTSCFNSPFEIKNCKYSPNGVLISVVTRNKRLYVWKKNDKDITDCIFIDKNCKSDIKHLTWHFKHKYLITAEYGGAINFFIKSKYTLFFKNTITFSSFYTILKINFSKNGKNFHTSTGQGNVLIFSKKNSSNNNIVFFFCTTTNFFCTTVSEFNSSFFYTAKENGNITFKHKFLIKNRYPICLYTGSFFFFKFKVVVTLKKSHLENTNHLTWHPLDDNIVSSCSDDTLIFIWYCSFSNLINYRENFIETSK